MMLQLFQRLLDRGYQGVWRRLALLNAVTLAISPATEAAVLPAILLATALILKPCHVQGYAVVWQTPAQCRPASDLSGAIA
jgi:hypothetical protein